MTHWGRKPENVFVFSSFIFCWASNTAVGLIEKVAATDDFGPCGIIWRNIKLAFRYFILEEFEIPQLYALISFVLIFSLCWRLMKAVAGILRELKDPEMREDFKSNSILKRVLQYLSPSRDDPEADNQPGKRADKDEDTQLPTRIIH